MSASESDGISTEYATRSGTRANASLRFIQRYLSERDGNQLTGLILGQLDAFNRISSTFGHETSSTFCARYTSQLREHLPPGTPVIRLSERRFAVLLRLSSVSAVVDVAAELAERSQPRFRVGGDRFLVDLTLGVSVYPTHADDAASLFRRAELALKSARDNELTFDIYQPDSTQQHATMWKMESDLERAVRQGELQVFYQPKLDLGTGRISGLESLVRWRNRSGHFVPPEEFIPIAERGGCIVPLTWCVFDNVEQHARAWAALSKPFSIAINVSPQVLTHRELEPRVQKLTESLAAYGMTLTIEITEDSLVQSSGATPDSLERLREMGIDVAIDDFGKGYSSLTYLKEIPATEIKVDRHFVSTIAADEKDREIVRSVVELGHALGMRVVAEGVDSAENLAVISRLGCEVAQGFYIARPMRAEMVFDWINSYTVATLAMEARTRGTSRADAGQRPPAGGKGAVPYGMGRKAEAIAK